MKKTEYYIGIDIGGSYIKYGLISNHGTILVSDKTPTNRENPQKLIQSLIEIIQSLQKIQPTSKVGISLPGVINHQNQMLTSGALVNMKEYDLVEQLTKQLNVQVSLMNDANAIACGEQWMGAGRNCNNFICLPIGTGVGGAIILDGKLIKGRNGAAGEFGMWLMKLGQTDPLIYESSSFQCGAVAGLARIYSRKKGYQHFKDWEKNIPTILDAATNGDIDAIESLNEFYHNIAVLLLNITLALDPEKILIGGGVSENSVIMAGIHQATEALAKKHTEIGIIGFPEILSCQLGNNAGMIGAISKYIFSKETNK